VVPVSPHFEISNMNTGQTEEPERSEQFQVSLRSDPICPFGQKLKGLHDYGQDDFSHSPLPHSERHV
jgi:hypothetical protein